jgi:hypothetical protein
MREYIRFYKQSNAIAKAVIESEAILLVLFFFGLLYTIYEIIK